MYRLPAGHDKETMSRNRIRKCVTSFFTNRTCVTLKRPVEDEAHLQQLDTLPESMLRKEFREQVDALRAMLFDNARVKTINGRPINGPMLIALAQSYVQAINDGGVPNVGDAWESAAASQCQKLMGDAVKRYHNDMDPAADASKLGRLPVAEHVLREVHTTVLTGTLAWFEKVAPNAPTVVAKFRGKIDDAARSRLEELLEENRRESQRASASLCRELRKRHTYPAFQAVTDAVLGLSANGAHV